MHVACSQAAGQLRDMTITRDITPEEEEMRAQATTVEDTQDIIDSYVAEIDKIGSNSKIWKKVHAFAEFARPVLHVFQQANFTPEVSLALGLVGMLLIQGGILEPHRFSNTNRIQPLNSKSEIEEMLESEINQLGEILSQVKFNNTFIKTLAIGDEIQGLSAAIVDFLVHSLKYQKKLGIVKALGSMVTDYAKRFQSYLSKIKGHANKIERLSQQGYTSVLMESKQVLDATSLNLYELREQITAHTAVTSVAISTLQETVQQCREAIDCRSRLEAIRYTHELSSAILQAPYDICDFKQTEHFVRKQEALLATSERWENNVSKIQAPGWLDQDPRPMLWIGGRQNNRGVSWVSSFSMDFVQAIELEQGIEITYIFCADGRAEESQTPLRIFNSLTLQLLKSYPDILSVPENLENLSIERFKQVGGLPDRAFKNLSDVLAMVDENCQQKQMETFILIDRVDICLDGQDSENKRRFLRGLQKLNAEYKTLRLILTSQYPVGEEASSLLEVRDAVTEIWVDTTRPRIMSSR